MFSSQGACPDCRTARTPDDDKEQALVTSKALVHNFQTLAILLDSVSRCVSGFLPPHPSLPHANTAATSSAGQTEILTANIRDSLGASFSSCLLKGGGGSQLPQELVQKTIGVLDQFHKLSSGPPKCPTIPQKRGAAINGENCKPSHHPLEEWSLLEKRTTTEFYYLASMQALEQLKDFESGNNRHKERDKYPLIAQFKNLVSCADTSGLLEEMVRRILSDPKYRGTPNGERESRPVQESTALGFTRSALEEAPIPPKTPHISPRQGAEQLSSNGHRDIGLHEPYHPLGPLLPPRLVVSEDFQTHWKPEGADAPSNFGTSSVFGITVGKQKAPHDAVDVIPKGTEPAQPHSGLIFKTFAAVNLTSFTDLYKPVLLDYFPIRDIPKEHSPVLIVDSAATPLTFTTFWRNLNTTEASKIFRWMNVYRATALDIANSFKKDLFSYDDFVMPQGGSWIPFRYPRVRFIRDMHANFKQMYSESPWSGAETIRFLNTCGTCRSLTTDSFSKPRNIFDNSGRALLLFAIRFDGINVVFQDSLRQIVVPASQTYTSPGKTLIITPVLHDPHQSFDDLSAKTTFEVSSQFSWLSWDQVLQSFLGIVPESLLTEAHTKAISQLQGLFIANIPIIARTVVAFSRGVQYETRVRAQVKLRISKNLSVQDIRIWEEQRTKYLSTIGPISRPTSSSTAPDSTRGGKKPLPEAEHERCVECDEFYNSPGVSEAQAAEDQPSPGDSILVFLWGQGFSEWMNIVFLAVPQVGSAKYHRVSNPDSNPLSSKNIELNAGGGSRCPLMDRVENQMFRIGVELEIWANHGTHSRLHREICNNLEASTGAIGLFYESDIKFIPSFTAVGPIDTLDGEIINSARGSRPRDTLSKSSTSWTKAILQKVLEQLACFRYDFNETIKINIHIGIEAFSGYELREVKTIAKAIILFGGLLNGIGLRPSPGHHKCCLDTAVRVRSNVKHIQAIDEASSTEDVAKLMNSLEASGYTYHGEPGPENQRYDFSCVESQAVIIWIQIFPKFDAKDVIDWISMILLFNRTAISVDSSLYADLSGKPITLASLNGFIAKG
ncbi:unnamed protein product [Tuber aestivum]|uniref:Uncharacterized protein n=1 Tax=Tuber aestivum TaxID=59557 RepID=A0A292PHX9_9PEZI|nr:unnamed protein product [Tuber aestivum]